MTVYELGEEWYNLSITRRKEALHKLVDLLIDMDEGDPGLEELLIHAVDLEEDDYFGTEGARL